MISDEGWTAAERHRLAALRDLLVLDTDREPVFDSIVKMAAEICGTPVALISLIDEERQWFKANFGLDGATETPREIAFCAHAILGKTVLEVPDATQDARFADNPLVTGAPDVRFYAGAPLTVAGGECVGTLCVIDRQARSLSEEQRRMLCSLAAVTSDALMMRADLITKTLAASSDYEQALAKSESLYRQIVDEQIELISLARVDGLLTYVNPAYASQFGRTPADMIGRNLFEFIDPADREAVQALLAEVARSGRSARGENRMLAADGAVRWVAWSNSVQLDPLGQQLLQSVGRDITQQKQADEALRASQSLLRRTERVSGVGGWELDLKTSALHWSEQTRRIHEVPDDYRPTLDSAIAFYAPQARASIQTAVQTAIDRGDPWDLELPMVTATGRSIWVRAVGSIDDSDGQAVRLNGAFQDVSERKSLEHRIASQAATLALVTEAIPATVAVVDVQGRYRFVNSAFERWCGRTRETILGSTAREVLGEKEFERRWPWVQRAFAGEAVVFELDYPTAPAPTYLSLNYVPLRLGTGELDGFVVVTQDVTRQREEALRLIEMTQRDPLTELLNRSGFEQYMKRSMLDSRGAWLAVLYIDLDFFKPVNDRYGHAAGDQVLKQFAQRLVKLVRPTDAVARLGGDEFAVALAGTREPANAHAVADKIVVAARAPFEVGGAVIRIGASVGVAFSTDRASEWSELVERADAKLMEAKAAGRGRQAGEA